MKSRTCVTSLIVVVLALAAAVRPQGIYAPFESAKVPVARLAANLERQLQQKPKSDDIHVQLARLYGMAYALNTDAVPATPSQAGRPEEVWFGHDTGLIPYGAAPGTSRTAASQDYLARSLKHYRAALALNEENLLARLGYGWTLERSGDRTGAISEYRRVIESAWPKERDRRGLGVGERFYTHETAGYLIPLLDPQKHAEEIAELRNRMAQLERIPRAITPIAIPLSDGATPQTIVDLDAQVPFDADGSGRVDRWTWISPDAGWLVYDADRSGRITSALQWFGNVTFWLFWHNGYEALRALDDDADGALAGRELRYLAIWQDADRDGVSDPGEIRSLDAAGIMWVSCRSIPGDGRLVAAQATDGVRLADGRVRPTYDVILRPSRSVSAPEP